MSFYRIKKPVYNKDGKQLHPKGYFCGEPEKKRLIEHNYLTEEDFAAEWEDIYGKVK